MDATSTEESSGWNKNKKKKKSSTPTTATTSDSETTGVGKKKTNSDRFFDVEGQGRGGERSTTRKANATGGGFAEVVQRHTIKSGGGDSIDPQTSKLAAVKVAAAAGTSTSGIGDDQDQEAGKKKRGSDQVLQINSNDTRLNEDSTGTSKRKKVPPKPVSSSSATVAVAAGSILDPTVSSSTSACKKKRAPKASSPIRSRGPNANQANAGSSVQNTMAAGRPIVTQTDSSHPSLPAGTKSTEILQKEHHVDISSQSSHTGISKGGLPSSVPTGNVDSSRISLTRRTNGPGLPSNRKVWDIESALMYLVSPPQPQAGFTSMSDQQKENGDKDDDDFDLEGDREYLIKSPVGVVDTNLEKDGREGTTTQAEQSPWITFRVAHAGDASTLASWYKRQKKQRLRTQNKNSFEESLQGQIHGKETYNKVNCKSPAVEEGLEDPDDTTHEPHPTFDRRGSNGTNDDDSENRNGGVHHSSSDFELKEHMNESVRRRSSSTVSSAGDGSQQSPSNSANINVSSNININNASSDSSSSMLEHWIAEGLGDEDSCPSLYGLLAYVHRQQFSSSGKKPFEYDDLSSSAEASRHVSHCTNDDNGDCNGGDIQRPIEGNEKDEDPKFDIAPPSVFIHRALSAAVLFTVIWQDGQRCMKIEWLAIGDNNDVGCNAEDDDDDDDDEVNDPSTGEGDRPEPLQPLLALIVQQKIWLRLTALSLMIECPLISIDEEVRSIMTRVASQVDSQRNCLHETPVSYSEKDATNDDDDDVGDDDENRSGINTIGQNQGEDVSDQWQGRKADGVGSEDLTEADTIQKSSSI